MASLMMINGLIWVPSHPESCPDHIGLIPTFLDPSDERSATEQFNDKYIGGWRNQPKFTIVGKELIYPEDPPLVEVYSCEFRDETIKVYECGYVAVIQKDGSFEACRMD